MAARYRAAIEIKRLGDRKGAMGENRKKIFGYEVLDSVIVSDVIY